MRTKPYAVLAALLLLMSSSAWAQLKLNFSTTYSDPSQVYVTFQCSNPTTFSATYIDATTKTVQTIPMNTHDLSPSIALSNIDQGVITLNKMVSGLIYASVGGPLGQTAAPAPTNSGDPGYNIPWQNAAEITYSGAAADSGDITSIQFFALNATVQVLSGTKVLQTAGFNIPTATLYSEIAALSSTPDQVVIKSTKGNNIGQIVRVLAPNQFGGTKNSKGTSYYSIGGFPSFQSYVQSVHQAGTVTKLQGNLGAGAYNFTSTVNATGDIVTVGNYGTGVTYTITMPHDFPLTDGSGMTSYIQSSTMYFCPAGANNGVIVTSSDGSTMDSSELAQVLHDLCTGYNFGFINSPVLDPVTHVAFGTESSNLWFKNATGTTVYAGLQPAHPYYNQYAALISAASGGSCYGFPYADAVAGVTLDTVIYPGTKPSSNVTAWNIIIGDTATTSDIPAMPLWAVALLGGSILIVAVRYLSPRRIA